MVGEVAAAGEVVSGALLARAVEPGAGEGAHSANGLCLNCGTRLNGPFCHACGQNGHVHKTLVSIGHDVLHGVFHFEGKIWRTLPMLALRPGELTRRYIGGERARFVSPLAAFLFSIFLMFAVLGSLPGWGFGDMELLKPGVASGMMQARTKLAEERAQAEADLKGNEARLTKERDKVDADPERIVTLAKRGANMRKAIEGLGRAEQALPGSGIVTFDADDARVMGDEDWLGAKWRHAKENPALLLYKLKSSAYKYSWALIPISLPFLWLLFPLRRDVGMYDHAIFATYSLTFMSLLVLVLAVLAAIGVPEWLCWTSAGLVPPTHLYKQLKGAYGIARWAALWRLAWLLFFSSFTLTFFALMLIWLGLDG